MAYNMTWYFWSSWWDTYEKKRWLRMRINQYICHYQSFSKTQYTNDLCCTEIFRIVLNIIIKKLSRCLHLFIVLFLPQNSICSIPWCGNWCFPFEGYYLQGLDLHTSVLSSNQGNLLTLQQAAPVHVVVVFIFWGVLTPVCVSTG